MVKDKNGLIWISTNNGLLEFDLKKAFINKYLHNANDATTISGDMVTSVLLSSSDDIWASTGNPESIGSIAIAAPDKQWGINRLNKTAGGFIHYLENTNILCCFPMRRFRQNISTFLYNESYRAENRLGFELDIIKAHGGEIKA